MGLIETIRRMIAPAARSAQQELDLRNPYLPVSVSEQGALGLATVWSCVSLIGGDLASSPLIVYESRRDGSRRRAVDHPVYALLRRSPNPIMTPYRFIEQITTHLLLYGNAFCEVERKSGRPSALWPIPPWLVSVKLDGGKVIYSVRVPKQQDPVELGASRIIHIAGISLDGVTGVSPIRAAADVFSGAKAVQEFGVRFFSQGGAPGLVLSHPGRLSDQARENLRSSWRAMHEGLSKAHRLAILEEGMKLERIGLPPQDAQMIETRRYTSLEIARIFRVPPHMIGEHERGASYASVEQQAIDYVTHTLRPWAVRIEQSLTASLLDPSNEFPGQYYCEFLLDALLRGDTLSRYRAYAIGRQWGWLSANDVRVRENMDPIDGGDTYLSPLNMVTTGEEGAGNGDQTS